jgi:hypothetical protein
MDKQGRSHKRIKKSLEQLEAIVQRYKEALDGYTLDQLQRKPSAEQWSLGQLYVHLNQTALNVYFGAVRKCFTEPDGNDEEKTEVGREIFELGGFPPVKIKVPDSPAYTPKNPENKHVLSEGLQMVLDQANELASRLLEDGPSGRVLNRRLGALDAVEWFQLAEMHYRHHWTQKTELEQAILGE